MINEASLPPESQLARRTYQRWSLIYTIVTFAWTLPVIVATFALSIFFWYLSPVFAGLLWLLILPIVPVKRRVARLARECLALGFCPECLHGPDAGGLLVHAHECKVPFVARQPRWRFLSWQ